MQNLFTMLSTVIVLNGLFIQFLWLFISRVGKNRYLDDLTSYRVPKSRLSRYYGWRLQSVGSVIAESIVLVAVVLASGATIAVFITTTVDLLTLLPIFAFVGALTLVSGLQTTWRVKGLITVRNEIATGLEAETDKIGKVRELVDKLDVTGSTTDGRVWFALFQLAQEQNAIGWSIRDVLIEKRREIQDRVEMGVTKPQEPGPDIQ
jgi:hypothetical protein